MQLYGSLGDEQNARFNGCAASVATVCGENPRVLALIRRLGSVQMTWRGGDRELVVGLER